MGTIAFNFQERFLNFNWEGKEVALRGTLGKKRKIISSNGMKNILKKEERGVIAQLCSLEFQTLKPSLRENSKVQVVEDHIEQQQQVLQLLKDNLNLAHNRMKQ